MSVGPNTEPFSQALTLVSTAAEINRLAAQFESNRARLQAIRRKLIDRRAVERSIEAHHTGGAE